jgi:hypothetical protein
LRQGISNIICFYNQTRTDGHELPRLAMVLIPTLCLIGSAAVFECAAMSQLTSAPLSFNGSDTSRNSETDFLVSMLQEKESRTPAQKKIDSRLLYALYRMRGEAEARGIPPEEILLVRDGRGRVLIDVRARVNDKLVLSIQRLGGKIVSRSDSYNSIIAYAPLGKLESIARFPTVKFIMPAAEARTN